MRRVVLLYSSVARNCCVVCALSRRLFYPTVLRSASFYGAADRMHKRLEDLTRIVLTFLSFMQKKNALHYI